MENRQERITVPGRRYECPRVGISNAKSSKLVRGRESHGLKPLGRLPGGGGIPVGANDESDLERRLGERKAGQGVQRRQGEQPWRASEDPRQDGSLKILDRSDT